MLQLKSKTLTKPTQDHLNKQQAGIDTLPGFASRATRAGTLWKNKTRTLPGQKAFDEVKTTLIAICIGVEICNYCEQNEANDVEHILPKSLFPDRAFVWNNYLLACKTCNSTYKSDAMYVFDPESSASTVQAPRGAAPPSADYAFIQPRLEDPMDYMQLNFQDFYFYAKPPHEPGTRGFKKTEHTLEILGLNNRPNLVKYRSLAFDHYKRLLREYVAVKNATTYPELEAATAGNPAVNPAIPFHDEQQRILNSIQQSLLCGEHPTVLREMIRQRGSLPAPIQELFRQAPEALSW